MSEFDRLDDIAADLIQGADDEFGPLSTGEKLYAAIAANRCDLLKQEGYTITQAIARLGDEWLSELVRRHRY